MKNGNKKMAALLALILLAGVALTGCGGQEAPAGPDPAAETSAPAPEESKTGEALVYDVWISSGEDASWYADYNDNVCVKYINTKSYEGSDGAMHNVQMNFIVPAAGTASDSFNTMCATGDYYDVMDLTQGAYKAGDLYEQGILLDLTPYMEECMPNYMALLNADPTLRQMAVTQVDGEEKFLQIYSIAANVAQWGGYAYRRDWVAKYGNNPSTGEAFTYTYDKENHEWTDDVLFPSWYNEELKAAYLEIDPTWDGSCPVFLSDWEWMLDIFCQVIRTQNIDKGYPTSLYYPGYFEVGDLVTGFNMGGVTWYNDQGTARFGPTEDNFKTYLEAMNSWFFNGWIDTAFQERTGDMFYEIDLNATTNGRVGLWYSQLAYLSDTYASENPDDPNYEMFAFPARQPINDVYGSGEAGGAKFVPGVNEFVPTCFYAIETLGSYYGVTEKAAEKDVKALLRAMDYLFSDEGGVICSGGLTKEQYDAIREPGDFYEKIGCPNGVIGVYDEPTADGKLYYQLDELRYQDDAKSPAQLKFAGYRPESYDFRYSVAEQRAQKEWKAYKATGHIDTPIINQLSVEEAKTYNKSLGKVRDYMSQNVYQFIKGMKPLTEENWESYKTDLTKRNIQAVTDIFQSHLSHYQ